MKAATVFPYSQPSPGSVEGEGKGGVPRRGVPGRDILSPRRHDMKEWLHDHHYHQASAATVDNKTPIFGTTTDCQPPSLPFLEKRSPPSKPQPRYSEEQHKHKGQVQQQQQQNASAFMAAFLRDAASVTVPTKTSDHDSRHGRKKNSSNKQQQKFTRRNLNVSARSDQCDDISLRSSSSSIGNLSECLNELARSSTKNEEINGGQTFEIRTILTKQSKGKSKQGCRRLPTTPSSEVSRYSSDSDDDLSLVSNLSDWNEMLEKTFGCDDPHSETEDFLHDLDKHVSEHVGGKKSCFVGGEDPGRNDSGNRIDSIRTTTAPKVSRHRIDPTMVSSHKTSNLAATPTTLQPILKVKDSHTISADVEDITADDYLDDLIALNELYKMTSTDSTSNDSFMTSSTDSDMRRVLAGIFSESNGNDTETRRNTNQATPPSKRLTSSMSNIDDMMKDLFTGDDDDDEIFDFEQKNQNSFASLKTTSDASERARVHRLQKKKAAVHTRALHDSIQIKPAAHTLPQMRRSRNNSYDDADRFLRSLEKASLELHKAKTSDINDQREGMAVSESTSKPVNRVRREGSVQSFDAFDEMLAEIEEEERRMESVLFKSKPRGVGHSLKKHEEGDTQPSHSSSSHSSLSRQTAKVICLKWVDRRGMVGHFTGEVNSKIQPHGRGILVYENGLVLDCNWCNGTPSPERNGHTADNSQREKRHAAVADERKSSQFHPDYDLGMTARSRHDMRKEDPDEAMEGISRLKALDFAFVRRSNNQWTYSIISDRTDDSIRFVIDEIGRTKRFRRDAWLKNIRRIQVQRCHDHPVEVGQKKSHSRHHRHRRRRSTSVPSRKKPEPFIYPC